MKNRYIYYLSAGHLANDLNSGALPAILPFLAQAYGMDYQAVAGLIFASCCLSSIVQPAFGYFADRVSKPWFMSAGILLAGFGLGAIGFLESYWAIFTAAMLSGVGGAVFHPEAARFANRVSGAKKGAGMSIFSVGGNGGFALGPPVAAVAMVQLGLHGTVIFAALGVVMAAFLFYQVPRIEAQLAREAKTEAAAGRMKSEAAENDWRMFGKLTVVIFGRSVIFYGFNTFIPLYWMHVLGQSHAAGATALTILFSFGVVMNFAGGVLGDRFGYVKVMRASFLLMIPLLFLFTETTDVRLATLLLFPLGLGMFAPYSSVVVLGQEYLARSIGFASGVTLGLAVSIGGIAAPGLGWIADTHGLRQAMHLLGYVAILSAAFTFLLPTEKKSRTAA